jgi:hypothetical protein
MLATIDATRCLSHVQLAMLRRSVKEIASGYGALVVGDGALVVEDGLLEP